MSKPLRIFLSVPMTGRTDEQLEEAINLEHTKIKSLDKALIADASISVSPYFSKKNKRWCDDLKKDICDLVPDPKNYVYDEYLDKWNGNVKEKE